MNQSINPWVAVIIITVCLAAAAIFISQAGVSTGGNAAMVERMIANTVIKPGNMTGGMPGGMPGGPIRPGKGPDTPSNLTPKAPGNANTK